MKVVSINIAPLCHIRLFVQSDPKQPPDMPTTKQAPRHILELTPAEQQAFLDSFDSVLCDCDGVVWQIICPIPHAGDGLNLLKKAGKKCRFVSNNSLRSDDDYIRKLKGIGVENVEKADLVHPVKTMINYLRKHKPGERVFSLCSLEANVALRAAGIDVETLTVKEHLTPVDLARISRAEHKVGVVLLDVHLDLSYAELVKAYQYLQQEDCILLVGGTDTIYPVTADFRAPGFVDFYNYLSHYTKKEALVLGKPSLVLGETLKEIYNITKPKRCLFVGDSLPQDIAFGNSCGFQTLYVLSGSGTKEDMIAATDEHKPDFYAYGLVDFVEFFKTVGKSN